MKVNTIILLLFTACCCPASSLLSGEQLPANPLRTPEGWKSAAPRAEISPSFDHKLGGGRDGKGMLTIQHDARAGLDGYWTKTFPVQGGHYYRFQAFRKAQNVAAPRRSALVRLLWQDDAGKPVLRDEAPQPAGAGGGNRTTRDAPANALVLSRYVTNFLHGFTPTAEAEHPMDKGIDSDGWTEVSDAYRAPLKATRAVVELHLQWAPLGRIEWSGVSFKETSTPVGRRVRLATVHFQPKAGKTPADKCRLFAPFIEEAAQRKADLVVLPETLTYYGTGRSFADCSEPIPGPSTDYFGALAKKHNLYIVAGLVERDHHLVYNVAVLLGPDGKVAGKYRKVCLPRGEIAAGIAPGKDYPVFDTRFGKVGMMVCYDGFFPEVARELSNRGAEVIAWPVWGCNPGLASARACENHVYLVSSTYEDISRDWMLSAIWDHEGRPMERAEKWGTVVVAEVDLDQRLHWPSLGDFKADLLRHRPLTAEEPEAMAQPAASRKIEAPRRTAR
ncbi:MAG: carbon-nitrogen hydrolase family protein [Verrucomicrobia bacterium]|nr:carbon-nitrogen hydrolase family protein [Verrucomicrobiota bacterium]